MKFDFDRFMDRLVIEEKRKRRQAEAKDTPQRELVKRYSESPSNRIRYVPKPMK